MAERICGGTPVQVTVSAICHAPVFTSRGCRLADIALPTTAPREATARILLLIFLSPFTMSVTEAPLWPNHGPKTGARQHQGAEWDRGRCAEQLIAVQQKRSGQTVLMSISRLHCQRPHRPIELRP